jgi:hypothetical protein
VTEEKMAAGLARQYTPNTKKHLYSESCCMCANPRCRARLVAVDEKTIVNNIAHIESAHKGHFRYNPNMTDEERRSYPNLLVLCPNCHAMIDGSKDYTVEILRRWKADHVVYCTKRLFDNQPSLLQRVVFAISDLDFSPHDVVAKTDSESFSIEEKIRFNNILRYREIINEFNLFKPRLDTIYDILETEGSFRKEKLLRNIRAIYLNAKGKYVLDYPAPQEIVKLNADNIIDDVFEKMRETLGGNSGDEDFALSVIMVDAFMRCKILEPPQ